MTFFQYCAGGFLLLLLLYLAVRLMTSAYFKSKQHYEDGRNKNAQR